MQDVSRTETRTYPGRSIGTETRGKIGTDYVSDFVNTIGHWFGQISSFFTYQFQERPMIIGSLIFGVFGAILGIRFAQMQAMQRRRNAFWQFMDTLGYIGAYITGWTTRRPSGPLDTFHDRGQDIYESTRDMGKGWFEGTPLGKARGGTKPETIATQVGYGLSLIPVTVALIRNPLVRDIGFRYLFRRRSGR